MPIFVMPPFGDDVLKQTRKLGVYLGSEDWPKPHAPTDEKWVEEMAELLKQEFIRDAVKRFPR